MSRYERAAHDDRGRMTRTRMLEPAERRRACRRRFTLHRAHRRKGKGSRTRMR